jgi:hypothetical protein
LTWTRSSVGRRGCGRLERYGPGPERSPTVGAVGAAAAADERGRSAMGLMDRETWDGKVFVGGGWVPGSDGDYAVVEPATSDELARMGKASADRRLPRRRPVQPMRSGPGRRPRTPRVRQSCVRPVTCGPSTPTRSRGGTSARWEPIPPMAGSHCT